jgi:phage host-nuclease inhibitor protein Gam
MRIKMAVVTFIVIATITLCLTLVGGEGAFAQGPGACQGDIQQFCKDVQQGGGRIAQCLKQHKQELSPECKTRIAEIAKQIKEVHEACEDDLLTFCPGIKPGGGRVAECLKANKDNLSEDCKAAISKVKEKQ